MVLYSNSQRMPARLWIVRHGESAGNVARDAALRAGATRIDIQGRDVDVPLSDLGCQQARAIGLWFAEQGVAPDVILTSPYRRAYDTAVRIVEAQAGGKCREISADERLREKEFGILDGLTRSGIEQTHPEIAAYRTILGKFYHRPPGGESWCDVILRLRSVVDTLSLHHAGKGVLIVTHQVVVLCLRYLLEGLDERQILRIDGQGDVANCAVTEYYFENGGRMTLVRYNHVTPMTSADTPITSAPDKKAAGA
jgi:probable phosphoglycerate mutase